MLAGIRFSFLLRLRSYLGGRGGIGSCLGNHLRTAVIKTAPIALTNGISLRVCNVTSHAIIQGILEVPPGTMSLPICMWMLS